jgi:hypothetical protein
MISQSKAAKTASDPPQTFSSWVGVSGVRIGRAHNLTQQDECWIREPVFFQDGIERNVFAVVSELAVRHVEYDSVSNF